MSARAAVLILEHQNPHRLAALAHSMRHPDLDIFVHIDARVALEPFTAGLPPDSQVTYVSDRVPVYWGGLSVVRASLAALRDAMGCGRDYGRYALLSGADLRVAALEQVLAAWSTPTEFVGVERRLAVTGEQPDWRVARRHWSESSAGIRRRLSGRLPRSVDTTIPLYHGSAWWALTAGAARYVKEFAEENPAWMRFHRQTFAPDEIIVPSIIASSPFSGHVVEHSCANVHGMHYIDWPDVTSVHPKVLGVEDVPALRNSSALFARKAGERPAELLAALQTDTHR